MSEQKPQLQRSISSSTTPSSPISSFKGRFRYCNEDDAFKYLPLLSILFLTINTILTLVRAYSHGDRPTIIFVVFIYLAFISLLACFKAIEQLPRNEASLKKTVLKIIIWVLYTAINYGIFIRFGPSLYPIGSYFIFALATVCSASAFYFFFIYSENVGKGFFEATSPLEKV